MEWSIVPPLAVLEALVMLFQAVGVVSLCVSRLLPGTAWAARGRVVLLVAMFGLAAAGALCGRHDSQFALFAGATMTVLLIGLIVGAGSIRFSGPTGRVNSAATRIA